MSATPVEPAPTATAPVPTEPSAAATTPATPAVPETPPAVPQPKADPPPANPWDDPKAAQAEIEKLRRENGAARTNAKAQAAEEAKKELAQTIGKALGLVEDGPVDPAKLTEQLTQTQAQAKQAALELAVYRSTPDATVANALLDSRSFLAKVANLDPSDGTAIAAAVGEAVTDNPALGKRTPAPNPAQGSSASGPVAPAQMSQQEVERLYRDKKYDEIEKARSEGRLDQLLGA